MEKISGTGRASFRWTLSCAVIGLAVSVSPCYAQESPQEKEQLLNRQEQLRVLEKRRAQQTLGKMQGLRFGAPSRHALPPAAVACDSLVAVDCFRALKRRMEKQRVEQPLRQTPAR